ncbi:MAG: PIN domain-containing protein [Candidatus Accumulibacter sp.]|nr:PIN domain-containing protein [Accumulibacter sp.]
MGRVYVLDACALIASLADEPGAETVEALFDDADDDAMLVMSKLNLLEVYYDLLRRKGKEIADDVLAEVRQSPVHVIHEISDAAFFEAGRLKAAYKISLADAVALAEASIRHAFVTSDHHEFDRIEVSENIRFLWIR